MKENCRFNFSIDRAVAGKNQKRLQMFYNSEQIRNVESCFAFVTERLFLTSANWTNSIVGYLLQVTSPFTSKFLIFFFFSKKENSDITKFSFSFVDTSTICCLAFDGAFLASASNNGVIRVFSVDNKQNIIQLQYTIQGLGNSHLPTCLDISLDEDLVVVGTTAPALTAYSVRGRFHIWTVQLEASPKLVKTSQSYVVVLLESNKIFSYSINGKFLASADPIKNISDMKLSADGEYLVTVGDQATIYRLFNLRQINNFQLEAKARSVEFSSDQHYIFLGLENGDLTILSRDY